MSLDRRACLARSVGVAAVSFLAAIALGQGSYLLHSRFIPGRPLDSVENRYAWGEAMKFDTGKVGRLYLTSGFALAVSMLSTAALFAWTRRLDGLLGFGLVGTLVLVTTASALLQRRRNLRAL